MEWQDEGVIISAKPYKDTFIILDVLTKFGGKKSGLARVTAKKMGNPLQLATTGYFQWKARLADHLGALKVDVLNIPFAKYLSTPLCLHIIQSMCGLLSSLLPEGAPHLPIYLKSQGLLEKLSGADLIKEYALFELCLLQELGFGLTLTHCISTQQKSSLIYLSPKSGHAVCSDAGYPYRQNLLRLPSFFLDHSLTPSAQDVSDGLHITRYFLEKHLLSPACRAFPPSRAFLIHALNFP